MTVETPDEAYFKACGPHLVCSWKHQHLTVVLQTSKSQGYSTASRVPAITSVARFDKYLTTEAFTGTEQDRVTKPACLPDVNPL